MDVNDILYQQTLLAEEIKKVLINYKKDGPGRRTTQHIRRRLETLEKSWNEYKSNHARLTELLSMDDDYFTGNYYEQTRQYYYDTKMYIEKTSICPQDENNDADQELAAPSTNQEKLHRQKMPQELSLSYEKSSTLQEDMQASAEQPLTKNKSSIGNNSKLDEMYKKQLSNFKAFTRTVSNINVEIMQEKWEFEDTLRTLQVRWKAIDLLHWELDSELDGSNWQYETRFTEHEQTYYDVKRAINSKLWSVSHREKSTPQLDIPIFNGNYQQWTSFKDLFSEAIHNNPTLSNAQKMQFLKSKLKGEAERLIQHLQISSENYHTCWEILNHRYNNKKLIFTTHMNTMMNLPITQHANANHIKRLHDVTTECLNAIKNIGIILDTWDPILVYFLVQKLDAETHSDYLESLKEPRDLPKLKDFLTFLENKFTTMESSRRKQENYQQKSGSSSSTRPEKSYNFKHYSSNKAITQSSTRNKLKCSICDSLEHGIYFCKQFLEISPMQKLQTIAKLNLCTNCLYNHNGKICTSNNRCRECNGCHNTILHSAYSTNNKTPNDMTSRYAESSRRVERSSNTSHVAQQCDVPEILLPTALINVQRADGKYITMRALVDQGSQVSLITTKAAQLLSIPHRKCKGIITGVGTKNNTCTGVINISCSSLVEIYNFNTDVFIMKSLTRNLPNDSFRKPAWEDLQTINLADPDFNVSKPIDILLGADIYSEIILDGIYKKDNMTPIAQKTRLGWILCGKIKTYQCNVILNDIQGMQRFWEIEDLSETKPYSTEENNCIEFYKSTKTRLEDGRYKVRLPLTCNIEKLGPSKYKSIAQFRQLERKFQKNNEIKLAYTLFIHEYQELGHMKLVNNSNIIYDCYLPHHCVLRQDSSTTTHRVVFNASEKTASGISLNDCMCKGPNLQKDILTLIMGWRQYKVAFTADIEKMFRQIWLHEDDQALQKIVWRDNPYESLQDYQLTTVTYDTKAAPFLAMMTLRQLASDARDNYPEAADILEKYFYMDDLLHGSHSLDSALKLKQDLINLLKSGGFNLRKWSSNYQELLQNENKQEQDNYDFKLIESTKTLGLHWNPDKDIFMYQCKIDIKDTQDTKRSLLSAISQLFYPFGWLTPLSTKMKLIFQQVWKTSMAWDDKLPNDIYHEWQAIKNDIKYINNIKIPRWLGSDNISPIELHGFCDASQKAYACVVYSKIVKAGQAEIKLIAGKSRIVPCNKEVSLPRLELCGALLLSKLMEKIKETFSPSTHLKVQGWIDSTAVLGWLQGNPDRWKPFVSNRVRKIVNIMQLDCWQYVISSENPADCASRGLMASRLLDHSLWWHGPTWLAACENTKKKHYVFNTNEEEKLQKQVHLVTQNCDNNLIKEMIDKYSSFPKLVRILAWVYRFATKKVDRKKSTWLSLSELQESRKMIIKHAQNQVFEEEICDLKEKKQISSKSKILKLDPLNANVNHITRNYKYDLANKTTKPRKSKMSFFTSIVIAFTLFLSILSSSEAKVNITKFRDNQSLYFDKASDMSLIKDEWKIVVYYQMEPYWQGNNALEKYINTLDKTCITIRKQSQQCDAILLQLRHGYEELAYYNQLLLSQQLGERPARLRRRRGLINGVGYLANSLFGVLDDRFAEQYKKDICSLQENQKHIVNLWKNQTTIVESENNLIKRIENTMNQQHKVINQHMMALEKAIEEIKNAGQANSISNDFAIASIIASNVLNNLKNLQNTLLDTIMDIYQGRFNLHLLTPEQLIDELSVISSKLPKDVSLPVDNIHSDIRKLYSLIKVKARMLQEYLLFEIKIPLISRESFEIFKIIPIPYHHGNKTITLSPVSDYVAINIKKDIFIPMSEIDVKACFVQEAFYCHSQKPEYQMKSEINLCEIENQKCVTKESSCKNTWLDSYVINTYIFMCCEQCNVRTLCGNQITAHQLTNTGLISVGHGCIIKTEEFTIYPHKPHTSEVRMTPNLYTLTIAPINHIINITIPHLNMANDLHVEFEHRAENIQNEIQELKNSQVLTESVSYHDIHHYSMIYGLLGVAITIAIVIAIRRMKCRGWSCRRERSCSVGEQARYSPKQVPEGTSRDQSSSIEMLEVNTRATQNKSTSPAIQKFHEIFKNESV